MSQQSYHSICAWTFNAGKGGFTPSNIRPAWSRDNLDTVDIIQIIKEKIAPKVPEHIVLGLEAHYDNEVSERNSEAIANALVESGISLAMITPGAHQHFAYGGICSPDPEERRKAAEFAKRAVALTYGPLKKAWNPDVIPSFVIWNGSYGYDLATTAIRRMYQHLKENIAELCNYEKTLGGELCIAIEPKPNEGHPAMLLPTVASAIVFWRKLEKEFGISLEKKGINKEFGHSEMIGLDPVYDTVEEIDNHMLLHMHINSQGYSDGILQGGPGKYDIDNGVRINGFNIAIAGLLKEVGYAGWKGHDMQARAHDTEAQGIDRIVRSILSWDACEKGAAELDDNMLMKHLAKRETAKAEDMMRQAVVRAHEYFNESYGSSSLLSKI